MSASERGARRAGRGRTTSVIASRRPRNRRTPATSTTARWHDGARRRAARDPRANGTRSSPTGGRLPRIEDLLGEDQGNIGPWHVGVLVADGAVGSVSAERGSRRRSRRSRLRARAAGRAVVGARRPAPNSPSTAAPTPGCSATTSASTAPTGSALRVGAIGGPLPRRRRDPLRRHRSPRGLEPLGSAAGHPLLRDRTTPSPHCRRSQSPHPGAAQPGSPPPTNPGAVRRMERRCSIRCRAG